MFLLGLLITFTMYSYYMGQWSTFKNIYVLIKFFFIYKFNRLKRYSNSKY